MCSDVTWVYTSVVVMSACPSMVCTDRRSAPRSNKCVANECRNLCGEIGSAIPATRAYRDTSFKTPAGHEGPAVRQKHIRALRPLRPARSRLAQVRHHRVLRDLTKRHEPALAPLAQHRHVRLIQIHVRKPHPDELAHAQPRCIHELQHREVACALGRSPIRRREQRLDLRKRENERQLARQVRPHHKRGGIRLDSPLAQQKLIKPPHRTELASLRPGRDAHLSSVISHPATSPVSTVQKVFASWRMYTAYWMRSAE